MIDIYKGDLNTY